MHDPATVAFDIRFPLFPKKHTFPNGEIYKSYPLLVTIWHIDPEIDGTDDSCGFTFPKLTETDKKIIDDILWNEEAMPYFASTSLPAVVVDPNYQYLQQIAGDCFAYVAEAWSLIAWHKHKRRKLTGGELWRCVNLAANPHDNLRAILTDKDEESIYRARRFICLVMRQYLHYHRPWWRHPRWHIHHWQIQIHFIQNLKRWLFTRCAGCGRRFR